MTDGGCSELAVEQASEAQERPRVIVFGLGRYGSRLLRQLREPGVATLGVDFDPDSVRTLRYQGFPVLFGDAEHYGYRGHTAAIVRDDLQADALQSLGVEWFLTPFNDAADFAAQKLIDAINAIDAQEGSLCPRSQ